MGRQKQHQVLNIYGEDVIKTADNAITAAIQEHGAEDTSDAVRMICAAYTGRDFGE